MTILYTSPKFQQHITGSHPEHPRRLAAVEAHLDKTGLRGRCRLPEWESASLAKMGRVHEAAYIERIKQSAAGGGGRIEADTVISEQSYDVARLAAGAVCDAVKRVTAGEDKPALCVVRPPGHHA